MHWIIRLWIFSVFFMLAAGCGSTKKVTKAPAETQPIMEDTLKPVKSDSLTAEELKQLRKILAELKDIPFDFDKHNIPENGLDIIKTDIELLNKMLATRGKYIRITLEGNCDERGSAEYNLALGEKRANTVRDYLIAVGFKAQSLRTLSFGEEKPKVQGHTEEAWAANRRVHLVVE